MFRSTRRPTIAPAEQLELRILPTVKVNFNPGSGLLKITGDNAANRIDLDYLDFGDMEVFVDTEPVGTFLNVNSIKVNLKGGNDRLLMNGIRITGGLTANLGSGADEFDVDSVVNLGSGPDSNVFFGEDVKVNLGGDVGDLLDFDNVVRFSENASFKGVSDLTMQGDGTTYFPDSNSDIYFGGNLTVTFGKSSDVSGDNREIYLASIYVAGVAKFTGTKDVERFESITSYFQNFQIDLSGGDDEFDIITDIPDRNRFGNSTFDGGDGDDYMINSNQIFDNPPTLISIEQIDTI